MKRSMRDHFGISDPYHQICREERNLCALLYHLLLSSRENLIRLLELVDVPTKELSQPEIYVEYAHVRDIWSAFKSAEPQKVEEKNKRCREFILENLGLEPSDILSKRCIYEFNRSFIFSSSEVSEKKRRKISKTRIESPSNWSVKQIHATFPRKNFSNDIFLRAVRFKWCFNVKPDIIIFLNDKNAISIEAKLKSSLGTYPSKSEEIAIFEERGIKVVSQTDIQEQALKMLGIKAKHVILATSAKAGDSLTWGKVLAALDVSGESEFVKAQIESFKMLANAG